MREIFAITRLGSASANFALAKVTPCFRWFSCVDYLLTTLQR